MRNRSLVLALAGAFALPSAALADSINVNALIVDQLKKANKLNEIYGSTVPAGVNTTASFEGQVAGKGLVIASPSVIPERPVVLLQRRVPCAPVTSRYRAAVSGETSQSANFAQTDSVELKQEISVGLTYESPFGLTASTTFTAGQSRGSSSTTGKEAAEKVSWEDEQQYDIPANTSYTVQFVVTEKFLQAVPYKANLILSGDTTISFQRGQQGFTWVPITGNRLPENVIYPGLQENTRKLAVCRVRVGSQTYLGKAEGTTCWYGYPMAPAGQPPRGGSTNVFDVLVGSDASVAFSDDVYAPDAYTIPEQNAAPGAVPMKVCFTKETGRSLPGYLNGRGSCVAEYGGLAIHTPNYKVLRVPQSGGLDKRITLEKYLTEAQRTFNLSGSFSGVKAVDGEMRLTQTGTCPPAAPGPKVAGGASAASASASAKAPATQALVLEKAPAGTPVLAASVPTKKVPPKPKRP